jgi:hypothetical protein
VTWPLDMRSRRDMESGKEWVTANAPTFYERGKQAAVYSKRLNSAILCSHSTGEVGFRLV